MKGLILAGGFGTRMRPLTFTKSKPLIEFANKPIIWHQVNALKEAGCNEVILAVSVDSKDIIEYFKVLEVELGIKLTISKEDIPMGTAGPLTLAKKYLINDNKEGLFFMLNGDIICDYPFKQLLEFHKAHKKMGTIVVTTVEDPSRFGVIQTNTKNEILKFIEKPKEFISNKINAGMYLLNVNVIEMIEERPTSIEREIFPKMAEKNELCSFTLEGIWMDVGKPVDFITGSGMFLNFLKNRNPKELASGPNIIGNVLIHPSAKIEEGCVIGPNVVIGEKCLIKTGSRIRDSVIFSNSKVLESTFISGSIIGWKCEISRWCRIESLTILGQDVKVKEELYLNATTALPHIAINESSQGKVILF